MSSAFAKPRGQCCIDVWRLPKELLDMTDNEQKSEFIERYKLGASTEVGKRFEENSLTTPAEISFLEEAAVIIGLSIFLGGPLAWAFGMMALLFFGSWTTLLTAVLVSLCLAFHPMPSHEFSHKYIINSWFTRSMYKYFTYRFVWTGDSHQKIQETTPWIGAGVSSNSSTILL